jgi:hypothetical protein
MTVLSTTTKAKLGAKSAKGVAKNPGILRVSGKAASPIAKLGVKAGKPFAKRRARQNAQKVGDAVRTVATTLAVYGPEAARELGLVDAPKPKRTAPRVAAGVVIGAGAMYLLEPEHGREHREQLAKLVS